MSGVRGEARRGGKREKGPSPSKDNALAVLAVTDFSGGIHSTPGASSTGTSENDGVPGPGATTQSHSTSRGGEVTSVEMERDWALATSPSIAGEFGWNVAPHHRPWVPIVPLQFIPAEQDLNTPPDNWLRGLHQLLDQGPQKCTSLMLADMVADKVDWSDAGIDIISHTKTLKQLLMTPLTGSALSLVVHKIDDTLLIDDFQPDGAAGGASDSPSAATAAASAAAAAAGSHSPDTAAMLQKSQRELQLAFSRLVVDQANRLEPESGGGPKPKCLTNTDGGVPHHRRRKDPAEQRKLKLMSKFLARSINLAADGTASNGGDRAASASAAAAPPSSTAAAAAAAAAAAGMGTGRNTLDGLGSEHHHAWSFKDLRCLLSSDLQIFGDEAHPAVTLKLTNSSDASIQVLTGMDMWLDNLMCNVPEVVMCYHLNGVLQQYDLLKTEDIPSVSGFEPAVVHDIAQNVCSFLRTNCAKEGHTYWLYKEENADVVRLYDLTALCGATEGAEDVAGAATSTPSNPFAYPVAVLLFRIAARMYRAEEGASAAERDTATIESLLKNVLQLITATQYPELAAATTFLLVGLHTQTSSAAADAYRGGAKSKQTPPPRTKSKQKQSRSAKKGGVPEPSARDSTPDGRLRRLGDGISWAHTGAQPTKSHAALLGAILDLAYTNYLLLAEHLMGKRDGPRAIACAHMALMCHAGATATHDRSSPPTGSPPREPAADPSAGPNGAILPFAPVAAIEGFVGPASAGDTARARVLEVVGDVYSRMPSFFVDGATAEDDAVARRVEDVDRPFLQALQWLVDTGSTDFGVGPLPTARAPKFSGCWESHGLPKTFRVSDGEAVERAVHAYRQASAVSTIDRSVRVRLLKKEGNALNVFGIGVTNSIIQLVTGGDDVAVDAKVVSLKAMAIRARGVLSKAVEAFQRAGDRFNEALVNCNLAKLMRAHAAGVVTFLPESEAVPQQRELLDLAIEYYGRGQVALQERREHPEVWDSVSLDIAGTNFACARLANDHPHMLGDTAVTYFERAFRAYEKHRDTVEASRETRQLALLRAADVHHHLGCIYARDATDRDTKEEREKYRCAAEMHFQKSVAQYASEASVPAAALGRVESRLDYAIFQVGHDPAAAIGTLGSLATGVHKVLSRMPPDGTTFATISKMQTGIGTVLRAAIKAGLPTATELKGVYKQLLSEMQTSLVSTSTKSDVAHKGSRLASLLRTLSHS